MKLYDSQTKWNELYADHHLAYPAEGVIRILLGTFPNLKIRKEFNDKSILDLGFGDGRHFPLFKRLNMRINGVEISEDIVNATYNNKYFEHYNMDLRVGNNANIPFEDQTFDYLLTWNASYYMGPNNFDFSKHVSEIARVLKRSGNLIISVPTKNCFIFKEAEEVAPGYVKIMNDYFQVRDGEIMRQFKDVDDLKNCFSKYFNNFSCAEIDMDWFGLRYSWHVMVCERE